MRFFKERKNRDSDPKLAIVFYFVFNLANIVFNLYCVWEFFKSRMIHPVYGFLAYVGICVLVIYAIAALVNTRPD